MSRYLGLWAVIQPYVPSSRSMDRHLGLCAFTQSYVPSSRSMCRHLGLCAVIQPHLPSSRSMYRHPALGAVTPPYVPLTNFTSQIQPYPSATLKSPLHHTHLTSIKLHVVFFPFFNKNRIVY